jgi:WD40 repeat protein
MIKNKDTGNFRFIKAFDSAHKQRSENFVPEGPQQSCQDSRLLLRRRCRSGGDDRKIILWDAQKGERLMELNGHSKDNKDCTCDFDRWGDLKKANPACPVQGHSNTVTACVFAPHGKTIVSASWDKTLKVWDLKLGTCTTLEGHRYLCLFCAIAVGKTVKVTILPAALPRSAGERRRRPLLTKFKTQKHQNTSAGERRTAVWEA